MTATIQKILKPTKYRAEDTSSSYQIVTQNYVVNPAFGTDISNWNSISSQTDAGWGATHDSSDNSLKVTINSDGDFAFSQPESSGWVAGSHPFVAGKRYRVKFKAKGSATNQIRVQDDGGNLGGLKASDTVLTLTTSYVNYQFDWTANSYSDTVLWARNSSSETSWYFNIDDIEVYELQSFGNNNHGQIYSGRALEFDGLSDYLSIPESTLSTPTESFTVSCWIKSTGSTTWQTIYGNNTGFANGIWIACSSSEQLVIGIKNVIINYDYFKSISKAFEINTWNRLVVSFEKTATTIKGVIYLNGEPVELLDKDSTKKGWYEINQDTVYSDGESPVVTNIGHTGTAYNVGSTSVSQNYEWEGHLSDFQLWHKAWTQSDVTFDYLNPESLALNNSGTSLTESNLKLWYPMQDGHRGQKSYILDGANTGLGDNLVTNPTCDATLSSSSTGPELGWQHNGSGDSIMANGKMTIKGSGGASIIKMDGLLTVGVTYKITLDVIARAGTAKIEGSGGTNAIQIDTSGSKTFYYTTDTANLRFNRVDSDCDIDIDNVYVYPVNDKHHATTEFTSDELFTTADASSITNEADGHAAWTITHANTTKAVEDTITHNGSHSTKYTATGNGGGVYIDMNNYCEEGRTYNISIYGRHVGDGTAGNVHEVRFATNTGLSSGIIGVGPDLTQGSHASAWHECATTFIYNSSTHRYFGCKETGSKNDGSILLDSLSIKEVGVASGWTDADQQLDIAQTALQSYNQLAWFDGHNDVCKINDNDVYSFGVDSGETANDTPFTISAWINMNEATSFPIVEKYTASHREYRFHCGSDDDLALLLYDEDNSGGWIRARTSSVITGHENEWIHVVATYSGNESNTGITLYLNGESLDLSTDNSGTYAGMRNQTGELWIGASHNGANYANGCITETSIWNKELSQTEINELYNDGNALDAIIHSGTSNLISYWRNNGLAKWKDLKNPTVTTFDGTPTNVTETLLLPAGVDASRCTQGFYMNRQKDTNTLNLKGDTYVTDGVTSSADVVTVHNFMDFAENGFTYGFWFKVHQLAGNRFLSGIGDTTNGRRMYIGQHGVGSKRIIFGCGSNYQSTTEDFIEEGEWVHVIMTYDGTTNKTYVNGTYKHSVARDFVGVSADFFTVGGLANNPDSETVVYDSKAMIDDVLVYNRALTNGGVSIDETAKGEIGRIYNAGKRSHK